MSKGFKSTTYFNAHSAGIIQARTSQGEKANVSGTTNELLRRYDWLIRASLPELTDNEWQTLCNVYAGCWLGEFVPPARIASDMMDDVGAVALEGLEPDYAALVRKAHGWTQAEQLAVLDFIQRFWCADWSGAESFAAIKQQLLAGTE